MANKSAKNQSVPTLDLHGFKTEDVFDAVEKFLAKNAQRPKVRIMPGKGTGKVKARVIEYLKLANYPWSFERSSGGAVNEGVMLIHME